MNCFFVPCTGVQLLQNTWCAVSTAGYVEKLWPRAVHSHLIDKKLCKHLMLHTIPHSRNIILALEGDNDVNNVVSVVLFVSCWYFDSVAVCCYLQKSSRFLQRAGASEMDTGMSSKTLMCHCIYNSVASQAFSTVDLISLLIIRH